MNTLKELRWWLFRDRGGNSFDIIEEVDAARKAAGKWAVGAEDAEWVRYEYYHHCGSDAEFIKRMVNHPIPDSLV